MLVERALAIFLSLKHACRRLASCIYGSPIAFVLTLAVVLLIVSVVLAFNIAMATLLTVPGAIALNIGLFWLTLRLVVRVLVFPGSIICWKRNTEAAYRVETAKQFTFQLEKLRIFLQVLLGRLPLAGSGVSIEGALLGCMVVEGLARNFKMQQQDQVRFTKEQAQVRHLVHGVEAWIGEATVCERRGAADSPVPLLEWLQRMSHAYMPVQLASAVAAAPLASESQAQAPACIDRIEQLIAILDGLQRQKDSCCATARRFLRVPTVGSLHQLRAELLVRYGGQHHWVTAPGGRKIDTMFISCKDAEAASATGHVSGASAVMEQAPSEASSTKEDVPLKEMSESPTAVGPVVVWCNPNAAYYETMAYESQWLDFYLAQGCSVFLFNYSGFGRSQGSPTPAALAADGDAVIDFLRRRGFTNVAVHGRSIGGIAACSLAKANPDIVRMLIADRTFSTLAKAATYTFGAWAAHGLNLAATWADNSANYLQARCYKVMICDAKDATIPDLAALRTEVAQQAVEATPESERLLLEAEKLQRIAEAWGFLETLTSVCDRSHDDREDARPTSRPPPVEAKRPARPVIGKPQVSEADRLERLEAGEGDTQRLVGHRSGCARDGAARGKHVEMTREWLEEHVGEVRAAMCSSVDAIRIAMDVIGTQLNSSGLTLDDALAGRGTAEASYATGCFLANLQVWGSLGALREPRAPPVDRDIELFLQKGAEIRESPELTTRLSRLASTLTPETLAVYHRRLSRTMVADTRRAFRHCMAAVRKAFENAAAREDVPIGPELRSVALNHLKELEGLLATMYRFFKCVDIGGSSPSLADQSDDSEDPRSGSFPKPPPPPTFPSSPTMPRLDRSVTGYVMCIDCGHNGMLNAGEMQHLGLHLRAARFGKWATAADVDCAPAPAPPETGPPRWVSEHPQLLR